MGLPVNWCPLEKSRATDATRLWYFSFFLVVVRLLLIFVSGLWAVCMGFFRSIGERFVRVSDYDPRSSSIGFPFYFLWSAFWLRLAAGISLFIVLVQWLNLTAILKLFVSKRTSIHFYRVYYIDGSTRGGGFRLVFGIWYWSWFCFSVGWDR